MENISKFIKASFGFRRKPAHLKVVLIQHNTQSRGQNAMQLPSEIPPLDAGGLWTKGFRKECLPHRPLISVITAVFNGALSIENTILSVINQSYDNIEYIIIDGGSTDGTLDIIKRYEGGIDYWFSETDNGIYDAWNKGVSLSHGTWLSFIGADDVYLEGAIKAYVDFVNDCQVSNFDFISSRANLVSGDKIIRTFGKAWRWSEFKKYMNVAHVGSFHNKALFQKYGLFDTSYKICGDYELLLRPVGNLKAAYVSTVTVNMSTGGSSGRNFKVFWETAKAKMSTGKRNVFMCCLEAIEAIIKWQLRNWFWYKT